MRDEWHVEADGGDGDPAVAVVELVGERVAALLAAEAQLGAKDDRLVIGLDDDDVGEAAFEPSTSQSPHPARSAPKRS